MLMATNVKSIQLEPHGELFQGCNKSKLTPKADHLLSFSSTRRNSRRKSEKYASRSSAWSIPLIAKYQSQRTNSCALR